MQFVLSHGIINNRLQLTNKYHKDIILEDIISNDSVILNVNAIMCLISRAISPNRGRFVGSVCQHLDIKFHISSSNSTRRSGRPPRSTKSWAVFRL